MNNGKLFLIPTVIAEGTQDTVIPRQVARILPSLEYFLAEDIRTARRYLSSLKVFASIEALHFETLDKDTPEAELGRLLQPLLQGKPMGLLSESGCPGVADPGSIAVRWAHAHQVQVVPLVGPSSLLLALMASGLNGQQFAFHGYLPVEPQQLTGRLRELERESRNKNQTQIFIETPYRNNHLFDHLKKTLHPTTQLFVGIDLTGPGEFARTQTMEQWKKSPIAWPKAPAVFLFQATVQ
jgi:16S rRNA (cytidine1402-2'-O)-methyltransferase